jgi:hypothetical protein
MKHDPPIGCTPEYAEMHRNMQRHERPEEPPMEITREDVDARFEAHVAREAAALRARIEREREELAEGYRIEAESEGGYTRWRVVGPFHDDYASALADAPRPASTSPTKEPER